MAESSERVRVCMHVGVCARVHVHVHMRVRMHGHTHGRACACVCMHMCACVHGCIVRVCMCVCMHERMHTCECAHACMCACMHGCACACMGVHVHAHVRACACVYVCAHVRACTCVHMCARVSVCSACVCVCARVAEQSGTFKEAVKWRAGCPDGGGTCLCRWVPFGFSVPGRPCSGHLAAVASVTVLGAAQGSSCLLQTPNPAPSFDSGFRPRCPLGFGVLVTLSLPSGVSGAAGRRFPI